MSKRESLRKNECPVKCPHFKNGQQCPRCQANERLPHWRLLQALITSVMGVPYPGQEPIFKHTPITRAISVFATFYATVITTYLMVIQFSRAGLMIKFLLVLAIVASILITSGMLRSMSMYLLHYAAHGSFQKFNRWIGELSSMTAMSLSFDEYERTHLGKHHPLLTSPEDPDQQTIAALGFIPGMSQAYDITRLLRVLISPRVFLFHLRGRLASQFSTEQSLCRLAAVTAIQITPLAVSIASSYFAATTVPLCAWVVAWLLPLTYGTYVSMILFALGLHRWFMQREPAMTALSFTFRKQVLVSLAIHCRERMCRRRNTISRGAGGG